MKTTRTVFAAFAILSSVLGAVVPRQYGGASSTVPDLGSATSAVPGLGGTSTSSPAPATSGGGGGGGGSNCDTSSYSGSGSIPDALRQVTDAINSLDNAVTQVDSADLTKLLAVQTQANNLNCTILQAQNEIENAPDLDLIGSIGVEIPALQLTAAVNKLSDDLVDIEPYVEQAGVKSTVSTILQSQKSQAEEFGNVVISKVPALLQPIGRLNTVAINGALDRAVQAYQ